MFWTTGDICPRFQSQGRSVTCVLCCMHPCNAFLRFTFCVTRADHLMASLPLEFFWYIYFSKLALVGLKLGDQVYWTVCAQTIRATLAWLFQFCYGTEWLREHRKWFRIFESLKSWGTNKREIYTPTFSCDPFLFNPLLDPLWNIISFSELEHFFILLILCVFLCSVSMCKESDESES